MDLKYMQDVWAVQVASKRKNQIEEIIVEDKPKRKGGWVMSVYTWLQSWLRNRRKLNKRKPLLEVHRQNV